MKTYQLMDELEKLTIRANEIDKAWGESFAPLFDKSLFSCLAKKLSPCVKEAKTNLTTLIEKQEKGELNQEKAEYLCEKLLNQISALHRELNTIQLRTQEKQFIPKAKADIHQLHQDLAKHQTWERQLANNVRVAEAELKLSQDIMQQHQKQKYLLAAEKRLIKCTEARIKIEKHIAHIERKG